MDIEYILSKLPYNTYFDLMNSVQEGKTTIKLMRSDCHQIAGVKHPYFATLGMYMGFLVTTIVIIWLIIQSGNFWLLLYIPINFIFPHILIFMPKIKYLAWVVLIFDLFIIRLPNVFMITSIDIIALFFFYNVWWKTIYRQALQELKLNQEAFLWSWNRGGLAIEDSFGNTYSKFNMNDDNTYNKNLQLVDIVIRGLNVHNVDEAVQTLYKFYSEQGLNLDNIDLNDIDKNKIVTQLIMTALGTDNIDQAILETKKFYNL